MIAALLLVSFAAMVIVVAERTLPGARWTRRAPRLGVIAWQAASLAVPISLVLAGAVLALPIFTTASGDLAALLGACEFMLRDHYETPGGVLVHVAGATGAAMLMARIGYTLVVQLLTVRRDRVRQRRRVALVGRDGLDPGVRLVDDPRPAVFCIPGRRPDIVMTTGAVSMLSPQQRALALAHERAHLAGRHDLALVVSTVLRQAMPRINLFALAEAEIAVLVEMHADDRATLGNDRRELATALVALALGEKPAGVVAVNGGCAVQRVNRLLERTTVVPASQRYSISLIATAVILMPLLIAVAPALETAIMDYCNLPFHT